jgi:hypothetical protein
MLGKLWGELTTGGFSNSAQLHRVSWLVGWLVQWDISKWTLQQEKCTGLYIIIIITVIKK